MSRQKLLHFEPRELKFLFELYKESSCTFRLYNYSRHYVAFKVKTTDPYKYYGRPSVGVLLPGSTRDIRVNMVAPTEVPPDMQCQDEFFIKSVVVSPGSTAEEARKLFSESWRVIETSRMRVLYIPPKSERSLGHQQQDGNGLQDSKWLKTGVAVVLFWLIIRYLMLPLIWGFLFTIVMLVSKVANKLVSDTVEEWFLKIVTAVAVHFIGALFQRWQNRDHGD